MRENLSELHRVCPSGILARTSASVYFPSREDEKKSEKLSMAPRGFSCRNFESGFANDPSSRCIIYEVNLCASLQYRAFPSQEIQRYRVRDAVKSYYFNSSSYIAVSFLYQKMRINCCYSNRGFRSRDV